MLRPISAITPASAPTTALHSGFVAAAACCAPFAARGYRSPDRRLAFDRKSRVLKQLTLFLLIFLRSFLLLLIRSSLRLFLRLLLFLLVRVQCFLFPLLCFIGLGSTL